MELIITDITIMKSIGQLIITLLMIKLYSKAKDQIAVIRRQTTEAEKTMLQSLGQPHTPNKEPEFIF